MVTKTQNLQKHTQKREGNQNVTLKISHHTTNEESKRRKEHKRTTKTTRKIINKMAVSTYPSIITLNANGPNGPIKRHIHMD